MNIIGKNAAEIFENVRFLVQSRQLLPGQTLPSVRDLATTLGVNRNTVASAYKRLVTAGIAVSQGRLGTIIRSQTGPEEQEGSAPDSRLIDLAGGNPNPAWLPEPALVLAQYQASPRLYGEAPVSPKLDGYARLWFDSDCPAPFAIDLTHGAVDAIERLLTAYLVAGDKVAVETPCFLSCINTLQINGLQAIGIPLDSEGMLPDPLEHALAQGAQAVLVTPRAHNPTGCSLSKARARALQHVLSRYPHVLVIIDDHFAMLSNTPYYSVISDSTQNWALVRSVSKGLGPDMRLAFVASNPETSRRLRWRLASGTTWVSHVLQELVGACLISPEIRKLTLWASKDCAQRREWLIEALAEQGVGTSPLADGLNIWVPLKKDSQTIVFRMAQKGWLLRGGDAFGVQKPTHGVRITISTMDKEQARRLASDLSTTLASS